MTPEAIPPHSAPAGRGDALHALAVQLYELISSGHDGLAFHVSAGGPTLIARDPDADDPEDRFRVLRVLGAGEGELKWVRAKELRDGVERDRRCNPWVVAKHLKGAYSVALVAPGWVAWACIDVDAHPRAGESELEARRRAKRTLGRVWRALGCSAMRHPLVLRSPGGGYHVWLPLTRGEGSANPEHTWPARVVRRWVEWHLTQAGLDLAPGVIEVFPSGCCLRVPCGRGMVLLQATQPDAPDALGLAPWPGTAESRIDWSGEHDELTSWSRLVVPTARAFIEQWTAQRRTLADWLGRPEAVWDPRWACLGWRDGEDIPRWGEIFTGEKNSAPDAGGQQSQSQEIDDGTGRPLAGDTGGGEGGASRSSGGQPVSPINENALPPSAEKVDPSPDSAGGRLVRGRAFLEKVKRLLWEGVTEPCTRYDAVLTLAFYWAATCGLSIGETLAHLEAWCGAHAHQGSRLSGRPRAFLRACLGEAQHYLVHRASRWRFRARGGHAGGLGTLTPADRVVVAAVAPCVASEVATVLAWLAGRADATGRVLDPVQISHGLLERLCGDRRVDLDGDGTRRRAATVALTELERIGVLTLARNYCVGKRGRIWSCWYRFGSGEIARSVALPAAKWEEITPFKSTPLVPTPAKLEIVPSMPLEAPSAQVVEVRVVGERVVSEGLLRVLSDGARGLPRTLFTAAPGVDRPTAEPGAREPWWERHYRMLPFTPGRLWTANAARVLEERRKLPRGDRLDVGGGGRDRSRRAGAPVVTVSPAASTEVDAAPSSAVVPNASPAAAAMRDPASGSAGEPIAGGALVAIVIPQPACSGAVAIGSNSSPVASASSAAIGAPESAPSEPCAPALTPTSIRPSADEAVTVLSSHAGAASPARAGPGDAAAAGERSESALRTELADSTDAVFAAACDVDLLESLCQAWSSFRGRGRGS